MKKMIPVIISAAVIMTSCSNNNSAGNDGDSSSLSSDTTSMSANSVDASAGFVKTVLNGGLLEIEMAKLGERQSSDASLKSASTMMIKDHMTLAEKIKAYAEENNISSSDSLDHEQLAKLDDLQKKKGVDFDKSYLGDMLKMHRKDIDAFQDFSKNTADSALKSIVDKGLPTIMGHYEMLRKINKEVKATVDPGAITNGMETMPLK